MGTRLQLKVGNLDSGNDLKDSYGNGKFVSWTDIGRRLLCRGRPEQGKCSSKCHPASQPRYPGWFVY